MFGGHGSKIMRQIARRLDDTQLILVCGHNAELADELRAMSASAPRAVIGFSAHISHFMQLSDFFIGKPGPGSISEAVQQRLPVIVAPQRLDHGPGALQHRVGRGEPSRPGAELVQGDSGGGR
jgi:UDP-N-acetylglucosamine:LPS N-acetylglucosamine transferase